MNSRRVETIESLIARLYDRREEFYIGHRGCDFNCSSIMYGLLTRRMRSIDLPLQEPSAPYSSFTHKGLVEAIHSFTPPTSRSKSDCFNSRHACADSSFQSIIEGVEAGIEGLDLADFDL